MTERRMRTILNRQRKFSERAFGPGERTEGVCKHIEKELEEVRASGGRDPMEWIDIAILAFDGLMRTGFRPKEAERLYCEKITINEGRTWPDWRTRSKDEAIEHDRTKEAVHSD